jgi:hypothetical protein
MITHTPWHSENDVGDIDKGEECLSLISISMGFWFRKRRRLFFDWLLKFIKSILLMRPTAFVNLVKENFLYATNFMSPKPKIPHGNKCSPIKDLSSKKLLI